MNDFLKQISRKQIFTVADVLSMGISETSALKLLASYRRQGIIRKLRRDLYVAVDLSTDAPSVDRYQIGSHIVNDGYIAFHSALEFHGVGNQSFFTVYVAAPKAFRNFSFDGNEYTSCVNSISEGVVSPQFNSLVRVTDIERTIVDCIDRIDRCGGIEELVQSLSMIGHLDEQRLLHYISLYDKGILYKKCGFLLEYFAQQMGLSATFFKVCADNMMKGAKGLLSTMQNSVYHKQWGIYAPKEIMGYLKQGTDELV